MKSAFTFHPNFREWIESLGIPVTPIGPEVRSFAASKPIGTQPHNPPTAEQRRQMAEGTVAAQFETITAAAQGCDIIVAATALQVAARSVAEKMGINYAFVAYSLSVVKSLSSLEIRGFLPEMLPVKVASSRC